MRKGSGAGRWLGWLLMLVAYPVLGQAPAAANASFDSYVHTVEARLAQQHASATEVLAAVDEGRLRGGELVIERLGEGQRVPDAMLHHWRATAFIPNATAAEFEQLMRDFADYPQRFAPQVLRTTVLAQHGDQYRVQMRVKQKHVITVVMDSTYDVTFSKLAGGRGYSTSRSTQVQEIENAGTPKERVLPPDEEHGFLWRQNTYWSYEQRGGGLMVQVESVSLTRGIPHGLGWVIGPYVESVPRESLEFTLGRVRDALSS
jgi:hypothetical protein